MPDHPRRGARRRPGNAQFVGGLAVTSEDPGGGRSNPREERISEAKSRLTGPQENLKAAIQKVAEFNVATIRREGDYGPQFRDIGDAADRLVRFAKHIPLDLIGLVANDTCGPCSERLGSALVAMKNAAMVTTAADATTRCREIDAAHHRLTVDLAAPIAMMRFIEGWPELDEARSLSERVKASIAAADKVTSECQASSAKANDLVDSLKDLGAARVFEGEADVFESEAGTHDHAARRWLVAAIVLGLIVVGVVFETVYGPGSASSSGVEVASLLAGRAVVVATVTTFLFVALRQFAAAKHNAIVNRHRANALRVYPPLARVSSDPAVRDLVISHAASSIFAPQPTGLSKASADTDSVAAPTLLATLASRTREPAP